MYTSYAAVHRTRLGGTDVEIVSPGNNNLLRFQQSPAAMDDAADDDDEYGGARGGGSGGIKFSAEPVYAPIIPPPTSSSSTSSSHHQAPAVAAAAAQSTSTSSSSSMLPPLPPPAVPGTGRSSVMSTGSQMPVPGKFSRGQTTNSSALAFTPMTLAFRNLSYTVTLPNGEQIELLKGIDGYFKPGTMTALMGSSGR